MTFLLCLLGRCGSFEDAWGGDGQGVLGGLIDICKAPTWGKRNSLPAPPLSDTLRVLIDATEGHMLQTNSPWCQGEAPQIKMSVPCKEQARYPVEVSSLDWMPSALWFSSIPQTRISLRRKRPHSRTLGSTNTSGMVQNHNKLKACPYFLESWIRLPAWWNWLGLRKSSSVTCSEDSAEA